MGVFLFVFPITDFNTVNVTPGKLTHVFPGQGGGGMGGGGGGWPG